MASPGNQSQDLGRAASNALRGYPAGKLTSVLQNRNLLSLMLANVIVIVSQAPGLRGSVGRLSSLHAACMPPLQR